MPRLAMFAISGAVLIGCANLPLDDAAAPVVAANTAPAPAAPVSAPTPAPTPMPNIAKAPVEQLDIADTASQGGVLIGTVSPNAQSITLDDAVIDIAEDGSFLLGFNRDAANQALLRVTYASGRSESRNITVKPRAWDIERVNLARRKRTASESFKRRRAPELAQIVAARAVRSDIQGWRQQFVWPAKGRISGRFGNQRIYRGEPGGYHTGVDIARPNGTPIVAPADGVVTLAASKPFSLEGNLLMLDHGMGLNSAFLHLSKIAVSKGDVVKKGQYIGNIGSTGSATGPHLHWSMKWNAARLDPMLLTGPMPE
jgi:murein DD-endopeptidase MepM/ murein hydrolase activator NlpD